MKTEVSRSKIFLKNKKNLEIFENSKNYFLLPKFWIKFEISIIEILLFHWNSGFFPLCNLEKILGAKKNLIWKILNGSELFGNKNYIYSAREVILF